MNTQETKQLAEKTVGEIVAEDYRTAEVFKKNGIDFCCGGKVSLAEICRKKNVPQDKLVSEIQNAQTKQKSSAPDASKWELSFLADYIERIHHTYVKSSMPLIVEFAEKVALVHGQANPEVKEILKLVHAVSDELMPHMGKEEHVLFPLIRNIEKEAKGLMHPDPHIIQVEFPISVMEAEHENAGAAMHKMREISNNFTPPDHACNTWRVLYAKLNEFEEDLHLHVHLENNILFPNAIALQKNKRIHS